MSWLLDLDVPDLVADAEHDTLGRVVLAVAAQHEPDPSTGVCTVCRPARRRWRWWRAPLRRPCPTRRMLLAELRAARDRPHRWVSA